MSVAMPVLSNFSGPLAAAVQPARYSNPQPALAVLRGMEQEEGSRVFVHTARPTGGAPRTVIKVGTPSGMRLLVSQPLESTAPDQKRNFVEITDVPSVSRASLDTDTDGKTTLSVVVSGQNYAIAAESAASFLDAIEIIFGAQVMVVDPEGFAGARKEFLQKHV